MLTVIKCAKIITYNKPIFKFRAWSQKVKINFKMNVKNAKKKKSKFLKERRHWKKKRGTNFNPYPLFTSLFSYISFFFTFSYVIHVFKVLLINAALNTIQILMQFVIKAKINTNYRCI